MMFYPKHSESSFAHISASSVCTVFLHILLLWFTGCSATVSTTPVACLVTSVALDTTSCRGNQQPPIAPTSVNVSTKCEDLLKRFCTGSHVCTVWLCQQIWLCTTWVTQPSVTEPCRACFPSWLVQQILLNEAENSVAVQAYNNKFSAVFGGSIHSLRWSHLKCHWARHR